MYIHILKQKLRSIQSCKWVNGLVVKLCFRNDDCMSACLDLLPDLQPLMDTDGTTTVFTVQHLLHYIESPELILPS